MADASKEQAARTRRTMFDCWESSAIEHVSVMPGVADQGTGTPGTAGARPTPGWGLATRGWGCWKAVSHQKQHGTRLSLTFQRDHLSGMQCQPPSGSTSSCARWVGTHVALVPRPKSRKLPPKGPTKRPIGIAQVRCCFW